MADTDKILKALDTIVIVTDKNNNITYNNQNIDKHFIDLIKNNYNGEIYIDELKRWYHIATKNIGEEVIHAITNITIYKLREQNLHLQGISDDLTGLYNRKGVDAAIKEAVEIFNKIGQPFTVIMGDIDHFKQINDKFGHSVGDTVLSKIGEIFRQNIRKNDFVGRYGGEEFLIILKTDNLEQIVPRIEKIKQTIEQTDFNINFETTMTFGIQIYDGTKDIDQVIKEADDALYHGKKSGRNQIVIYNNMKNESKKL